MHYTTETIKLLTTETRPTNSTCKHANTWSSALLEYDSSPDNYHTYTQHSVGAVISAKSTSNMITWRKSKKQLKIFTVHNFSESVLWRGPLACEAAAFRTAFFEKSLGFL